MEGFPEADNSLMRESDNNDSTYFRSGDRVFCLNGKWYYQTREDDHGPFSTREAAALDMQRYVDEMCFFHGVQDGSSPVPGAVPEAGKPQEPDFADLTLVDKD